MLDDALLKKLGWSADLVQAAQVVARQVEQAATLASLPVVDIEVSSTFGNVANVPDVDLAGTAPVGGAVLLVK